MAPFVWGGAEELALHLQRNLIKAGHESEVLRVPFQWNPSSRIPSQMLLARALELFNADRVIALKFPAYLIRHPHKTLWVIHQYRQAYDLYDAGQSDLVDRPDGQAIRDLIRNADNETFQESRRIFCISEVTKERLARYNGFDSSVLIPPVNDPELFTGGASGDYIFAGGRINGMKRQHLLIEALQHTDSDVKLVVGGPPDTPQDGERLRELVERLGLQDRVHLDFGFLPRKRYADYVNGARAVAYLPYDEEHGYVAMEAAIAGKALISTNDSGGVLRFAREQQTGRVVAPEASALGEAMSSIWRQQDRTKGFGEAGRELCSSLGVNWAQTVETLLQ
nr:glycosyltransferase family 4 protein [Dyella acidiphila]